MTRGRLERRATGLRKVEAWASAVSCWPDEDARAWTRSALVNARGDQAILAIVVTGSAARNVDHCGDLDLVLVYRQRSPRLRELPLSVDLGQYECTDVPPQLVAGYDYLCWAVRFGQVLLERDRWWSRLRVEWNSRLPLPSATDARERARTFEHLSKERTTEGDAWAAAQMRLSTLTQLARAELSDAGVFPKSRPELADQLRSIGAVKLANQLATAMRIRYPRRKLPPLPRNLLNVGINPERFT